MVVAKVATLSEHAFEAPGKGPDLNPVLTAGGATDGSAPVPNVPVLFSTRKMSSSSGKEIARLEDEHLIELERQLSETVVANYERDPRTNPSMADDSRSLAPRDRRPHRPILVVANPSPDSDSDSANESSAHRPYDYLFSQNDPPSSSPPSPSIEKAFPVHLSSSREPAPLTTTNLPSHSRPHPASQSYPALSSPSGSISPPPSTPPPTDLITDPTSRLAFSGGPGVSSDDLLQQQPHTPLHDFSAGNKFRKIKAHISIPPIHHDRRLSGSPQTNPVCPSFASATPSKC